MYRLRERFLALFIVFLFIFPSVSFAQDAKIKLAIEPSSPLELEGWNAWIRGDNSKSIKSWERIISENPDAYSSLSYWYLLSDLYEEEGLYRQSLSFIDNIVDKVKNPTLRASLYWEKIQDLLKLGDYDSVKDYISRLGLINEWLVIGPFDNVGGSGFYKVFPPEEEIDTNKIYTGKNGMEVKWFPARTTFGVMKFGNLLYPTDAVTAYALTFIYSDSERYAFIRSGSTGALTIWLNDNKILSQDLYRSLYIDQDAVRVRLNKGWNKLLVKVCEDNGLWQFILRITDENGNNIPGLKYSLEPKEFKKETEYKVVEDSINQDYWSLIYGGIVYRKRGIWDKAEKNFLKALEISDTALPRYFLGITYLDQGKTDEGISELRKVIASFPEFVKAYVDLGWNRYDKELYEEAIQLFREGLKYGKNYSQLYAYLAWTYLMKGWIKDAEDTIKESLEANPTHPLSYYVLGLIYERRGWYSDAVTVYRKLLEIDKTFYSAFRNLRSIYNNSGNYNEAISMTKERLEREPSNIILYLDLADLYMRSKMFSEAILLLEKANEISPYYPEIYEYLGNLYYELEHKEKAIIYWEKALEIEPGNISLKDYLSFLKEETYTLADISKLIKDTPTQKDYPDASAIIILDSAERIVRPDGTSSLTYHKVIKILNEKGRETYGEVYIPYSLLGERVKILKARTIKPDGTEVEATAIHDVSLAEGYHLYSDAMAKVISMPALENNAIIEYAYTIDDLGRGPLGKHFQDEFLFQDFDPMMISRYTLVIPKGMNIYYKMYNGELEPQIEEKGSTVIYTWEMKDIPQIIQENYMPPLADVVPRLEITTFKDWQEVAGWYYDIANPKTKSDEAIKAKVIELTRDKKTLEDKAKAIYYFVANDIRYVGLEFGISGLMPHQASEVFKYKYGDCKDKATLLISMYREIGIPAYYVLVRTRYRGSLPLDSPGFQFDHAICAIKLNGKLYFLDGTAEDTRFGYVPSMDQGTKALLIDEGKPILVDIPIDRPEDNEKTRNIEVTLSKDGSIKGTAYVTFRGYYDTYLRSVWKTAADRQIREDLEWSLRSLVPNATLEGYQLSNLRDLDADVWERYSFSASGYAQVVQNTISFLPSIMERLETSESVAKKERKYPINYWTPYTTRDIVTYKLPDGSKIIHLPDDIVLDKPFAYYSMKFSLDGNILKVERVFQIRAVLIEPKDYPEYKSFIESIVSKDRERVVIGF
jgi:tetratricopeptide (TPR) repeat protein